MAKYIPVGEPSNESERRGIRALRDQLPDHYIVIGNIDLAMPRRKNTYEYDAVVVGEWGLHAVEIKGWTGTIRGDQRIWELEWGRVRNPFKFNEKKAKALRDLLVRHMDYLPKKVFCQSVVYLPLEGIRYEVEDGNSERLLLGSDVHDFFVDEARLMKHGPGPLLDDELLQKVVDTIVPLADPAPGLPKIESYEVEGELDRTRVPYREFVGRHKLLKNRRKVRIKRYEIDLLLPEERRQAEFNKIIRDMEALESLGDNIYISRAHEVSLDREDEQILYLVSEWVGPRTLRDFCDESEEVVEAGTDRYRLASQYALHLLRAAQFMHERQIVHRNLHPRVVYLTENGKPVPLKIADFDYARVSDLQSITGEVSELGTEGYAAPELWHSKDYDYRVDLYSVGVIIFEMFSGSRLYTSVNEILDVDAAWKDKCDLILDETLREIIDGMVAREPDRRESAVGPAIEYFEQQIDE